MFIIEDSVHAENQGRFESHELAFLELKQRAKIPFNVKPNKCPCQNWENCAHLIKGVICGYRIEEIPDEFELYRKCRYLDKLYDELAKGRKMEKILRSV